MDKITVSCIQMDVVTGDIDHNLEKALKLFQLAKSHHPDFIVFPEMFLTGFAYPDLHKIARIYRKEFERFFTQISEESGAYVIGGSIPEDDDHKTYNTCLIYNPYGKIIGQYRKMNLFSLTEEDKNFFPGHKEHVFETNFGKIGVAICYDLRFPEIFRKMALEGAKIIFVPAQFPHPRRDHWVTLLKARAIENQVFIVGCNRVGGMRLNHFGSSMIIDPNGTILNEGGEKEEIISEAIYPKMVEEARNKLPVFDIIKNKPL